MAVSPDGRRLLVSSDVVGHVRSLAVDPGTRRLTPAKIVTLVDKTVFLGFGR